MNRNENITRPVVRLQTYREAFTRLDAALVKNTGSRLSDADKIDRLRRAVFGRLPGEVEATK